MIILKEKVHKTHKLNTLIILNDIRGTPVERYQKDSAIFIKNAKNRNVDTKILGNFCTCHIIGWELTVEIYNVIKYKQIT